MRPIVRSFAIIWAVLAAIVALIFIIIASSMSANQESVVQTLVERGVAIEVARQSVATTLSVLFAFGFIALGGAVYSGLMAFLVMRENLKFPARLAVSIVGILVFVLLPGILMLIDTIRFRNGVEEKPEDSEKETSDKESV